MTFSGTQSLGGLWTVIWTLLQFGAIDCPSGDSVLFSEWVFSEKKKKNPAYPHDLRAYWFALCEDNSFPICSSPALRALDEAITFCGLYPFGSFLLFQFI